MLNGEKTKRTHDLNTLLKDCQQYDETFIELKRVCFYLNKFGVMPRYPFEMEILKRDAELAIKYAEEIKDFTLEKFKI